MQAGMERFTKAKTLAAIVAELQKLASATAPAVAVSIDVSNSVAVVAAAIDFTAALIGIVAERTGYPPEMLAMDADLEADLGIDSIKRVEILGALQKLLPAAQSAQMQATIDGKRGWAGKGGSERVK